MDKTRLKTKLESILSAIVDVVRELNDGDKTPVDKPRTICPICNLPFTEKDPVSTGGLHQRCYKRLSREGRLTEFKSTGVVLPSVRGRKKKIDLDQVAEAIKTSGANKSSRHPKKHS